MSTLVAGTDLISLDEPAWSLREINRPRPDSKDVHRYQFITVIREGTQALSLKDKAGATQPRYFPLGLGFGLVELQRDLGPACHFKANEFVIPGGVADEGGRVELLHTVGELYDIAEALRLDERQHRPAPAPSDMAQAYRDLPDKRRRARKRLSMFGPAVRIQRG